MKEKTSNKIIEYIKLKRQVTASELVDYLDISRQALFKHHLSRLLKNGELIKIGKPPKVFYLLKDKKEARPRYEIDKNLIKIINENYLIITPGGEKLDGHKCIIWIFTALRDLEKPSSVNYFYTQNKARIRN